LKSNAAIRDNSNVCLLRSKLAIATIERNFLNGAVDGSAVVIQKEKAWYGQ
jgi:hypothetical protein